MFGIEAVGGLVLSAENIEPVRTPEQAEMNEDIIRQVERYQKLHAPERRSLLPPPGSARLKRERRPGENFNARVNNYLYESVIYSDYFPYQSDLPHT